MQVIENCSSLLFMDEEEADGLLLSHDCREDDTARKALNFALGNSADCFIHQQTWP